MKDNGFEKVLNPSLMKLNTEYIKDGVRFAIIAVVCDPVDVYFVLMGWPADRQVPTGSDGFMCRCVWMIILEDNKPLEYFEDAIKLVIPPLDYHLTIDQAT